MNQYPTKTAFGQGKPAARSLAMSMPASGYQFGTPDHSLRVSDLYSYRESTMSSVSSPQTIFSSLQSSGNGFESTTSFSSRQRFDSPLGEYVSFAKSLDDDETRDTSPSKTPPQFPPSWDDAYLVPAPWEEESSTTRNIRAWSFNSTESRESQSSTASQRSNPIPIPSSRSSSFCRDQSSRSSSFCRDRSSSEDFMEPFEAFPTAAMDEGIFHMDL